MTKATYTYVSALAEAIEIIKGFEGKEELIEKLEALKGIKEREGKRKSDKPTKRELEKIEERKSIASKVLATEFPETGMRACEIGTAVGVSTSKLTGILADLVAEEKLIREEKGSYLDSKGKKKTGLVFKKKGV